MSQQFDARGNEWQGQLDQITGQTVTDARAATATLGAVNAEVLIDINGKATCTVDLRSAGVATLTVVFEGTIDGVNYIAIPAFTLVDAGGTLETYVLTKAYAGATPLQTYMVGVTGIRRFRVRVSAYTSGNVVVALRASIADYIITAKPMPSTSMVTITAAANSTATLSTGAIPAGLFVYITHIDITRNATAALAGTATLVITTTNFPTAVAWSVGNAMAAGGTQIDVNFDPTTPIKSLTAGTAVTIAMPVPGAAVLWRANMSYYVGA